MAKTPFGHKVEGLLCWFLSQIYRRSPSAESWPVYLATSEALRMDYPKNYEKEVVPLWTALDGLESLPWPDDPCLLGTVVKLADGEAVQVRVHDSSYATNKVNEIGWGGVSCCESVWFLMAGGQPGHLSDGGDVPVAKLDLDVAAPSGRSYRQELALSLLDYGPAQRDFESQHPALFQAQRAFAAELIKREAKHHWILVPPMRVAQQPLDSLVFRSCTSGDVFYEMLSAFTAILMPCGYQVVGRMRQGVGSKHMQRRTRGKRLLVHISADRLYKEWGVPGDQQVAPHFRHGHVRHLWKAAGIDRHTLPPDPGARFALAQNVGVRRVYVHPCWVGETRGSTDRFDWEIQTGETALDVLYASLRHKPGGNGEDDGRDN